MAGPTSRFNVSTFALGALTCAMGVYFFLSGLCVVPTPGKAEGPAWIGLCVGLVFTAGGAAVMLRGAAGIPDDARDLPAGTPRWLQIVYWLMAVLIAVGLAATGTWVAFGPGERHFTVGGIISGPIGNDFGRTVFGFGAVLSWLIAAAFLWNGARKFFGSGKSSPGPT